MLLTFFEICLGIIFVVECFVDYLWLDILFWSVIIVTIIDAWIRTHLYSKHTFRCKNCGGSFTMRGRRLLNRLGPWKMPIRINQGKEIEPRVYSRSHIECPEVRVGYMCPLDGRVRYCY